MVAAPVSRVTMSVGLPIRRALRIGVAIAHAALRGKVAHAVRDYEVRNDLEACTEMLDSGALLDEVEKELGSLS